MSKTTAAVATDVPARSRTNGGSLCRNESSCSYSCPRSLDGCRQDQNASSRVQVTAEFTTCMIDSGGTAEEDDDVCCCCWRELARVSATVPNTWGKSKHDSAWGFGLHTHNIQHPTMQTPARVIATSSCWFFSFLLHISVRFHFPTNYKSSESRRIWVETSARSG